MGVDVFGVDIMGVDILGVDVMALILKDNSEIIFLSLNESICCDRH